MPDVTSPDPDPFAELRASLPPDQASVVDDLRDLMAEGGAIVRGMVGIAETDDQAAVRVLELIEQLKPDDAKSALFVAVFGFAVARQARAALRTETQPLIAAVRQEHAERVAEADRGVEFATERLTRTSSARDAGLLSIHDREHAVGRAARYLELQRAERADLDADPAHQLALAVEAGLKPSEPTS